MRARAHAVVRLHGHFEPPADSLSLSFNRSMVALTIDWFAFEYSLCAVWIGVYVELRLEEMQVAMTTCIFL